MPRKSRMCVSSKKATMCELTFHRINLLFVILFSRVYKADCKSEKVTLEVKQESYDMEIDFKADKDVSHRYVFLVLFLAVCFLE